MDDANIDAETFVYLAQTLTGRAAGLHSVPQERRFRALFGVRPQICCILWHEVGINRPNGSEPVHLLWTLLFLKSYCTEDVLSLIAGVNRKTFRKWIWLFLVAISNLQVVRWNKRLLSGYHLNDGQSVMCISVDGTDVRIREPEKFDRKWFSHKFRAAALRYEVGISVTSGEIVWVFGPFPAGQFTDQKIFNERMQYCLLDNEKVLADKGYSGPKIVQGSILNDVQNSHSKRLRAYHEQVNGRLKSFSCLSHIWRHSVDKHQFCFFAVANIVQVDLITPSIH